jgi:hypothetical protein
MEIDAGRIARPPVAPADFIAAPEGDWRTGRFLIESRFLIKNEGFHVEAAFFS